MKTAKNSKSQPLLVVADKNGNIFEIPGLYMVGMVLNTPVLPDQKTMMQLPFGSDLFTLPNRIPVGFDPAKNDFVQVPEYNGEPVYAVAAFMAPAYVQVYRCAYTTMPKAPRLSLYSYSAVGWYDGFFYVPALRIDPDFRQDLQNFDCAVIEKKALGIKKKHPQNRLINHLVDHCVLQYGCPAARNFVMGRWECPVPTSPVCNAACIGCISRQPEKTGVTASHHRITFVPTVQEIVELTVPHLQKAERAVVSFGQGCEGEPLMVGDVLEEAVRAIRKRTDRGIINCNTNAGMPDMVERLFKAGLDSIRVSMSSAQKKYYTAYYQPKNYSFADVKKSLMIARQFKKWSSINYFVFPGLTDDSQEISALEKLIDATKLNMIQARNMNIDPEWYIGSLALEKQKGAPCGIPAWVAHIRKKFPWVKFGYFNPPREEMKKKHFDF